MVLINQTMARRIWRDEDPIGQHIWFGKPMGPGSMEPAPRRVVGIVSDVIEDSLSQKDSESTMYIPFAQTHGPGDAATFIIRTSQEPHGLAPAVREILHNLAPDLPLRTPQSMDDLISDSLVNYRFPTILISVFGGIALLIAAVGVYGVISYSVAQRTHEIGIRVALGASRGAILRMVLSRGLRLALIGAVIGLIASHWLTAIIARSTLRNIAFGSRNTCGSNNCAVSGGVCGVLDSGAARDARGSACGATIRVNPKSGSQTRPYDLNCRKTN